MSDDCILLPAELALYASQIEIRHRPGKSCLWGGAEVARYCYMWNGWREYVEMSTSLSQPNGHYLYVLMHELAHSTGIKTRLCRKGMHPDCSEQEGVQEELVANLVAHHLGEQLKIKTDTELKGVMLWRMVRRCGQLEWNHELIVEAKEMAQQSADYILNFKKEY